MSAPDPIRRYTVQDYLSWPDDVRCELIHGQVYDMTPTPSLDHQEVVGALYAALRDESARGRHGGGGSCRVFVAPVDVVLSRDTVVQPDVVVVCDPAKTADRQRVQGAPDLVVEVLSPSTSIKDRREKRALYEAHGVPEYLIVDPAVGNGTAASSGATVPAPAQDAAVGVQTHPVTQPAIVNAPQPIQVQTLPPAR